MFPSPRVNLCIATDEAQDSVAPPGGSRRNPALSPLQPAVPSQGHAREPHAGARCPHAVSALDPVEAPARLPPVVAQVAVEVMPQAGRDPSVPPLDNPHVSTTAMSSEPAGPSSAWSRQPRRGFHDSHCSEEHERDERAGSGSLSHTVLRQFTAWQEPQTRSRSVKGR